MSILYHLENYTKIIEKPLGILTSGTTDCGNGVYLLKAGTPISNAGAVANTGDAKYLVEEDFYFYSNTPNQPKTVRLIERGYVDLAEAEAAAGITYADAAKTALATAGIILVDGALEAGGGGGSGGGNILIVHGTVGEDSGDGMFAMAIDKTAEEILAAESTILEVEYPVPAYKYQAPEVIRVNAEGIRSIMWKNPYYSGIDGLMNWYAVYGEGGEEDPSCWFIIIDD